MRISDWSSDVCSSDLLAANAECHLKSPEEMAHLFRAFPEALANTLEIARRCRFSLEELRHDYPEELTTEGRTPQEELEYLTWIGAQRRYPGGVPERVQQALRHEPGLTGQQIGRASCRERGCQTV